MPTCAICNNEFNKTVFNKKLCDLPKCKAAYMKDKAEKHALSRIRLKKYLAHFNMLNKK